MIKTMIINIDFKSIKYLKLFQKEINNYKNKKT